MFLSVATRTDYGRTSQMFRLWYEAGGQLAANLVGYAEASMMYYACVNSFFIGYTRIVLNDVLSDIVLVCNEDEGE